MDVELVPYSGEVDVASFLIKKFWEEHNNYIQTLDESLEDLREWTKEGHRLYLISKNDDYIGFVHLGSRGCEIDWLEDIFVLPEFQGQGIGSHVIMLVEEIVKKYSESLYIEAAARNDKAIRLYQRIGYNCLNTITIRKDFQPDRYETVGNEKIVNLDFEIKKYINE